MKHYNLMILLGETNCHLFQHELSYFRNKSELE